ncbi:hypothetical protein L211DRAFT_775578 [Terfezia boudieri ATCC MYA-4762]|uniref:Uncharacterized protein n=1 Tax=Terfezia boudieri ATCC MYA-4762 TaxID=1051890 RepID=A0A3N4M868_9PEZI|nr:hypothetical protein L211DRAFT_775578 [Terfezia boudieri ATCC MYA-4762]
MLPFLRTAALRRGPNLAARARTARLIPRRSYGSDVHPAQSSSEMPWIIGSVAFTVPAVLYLMSGNSSSPDHSGKHSSHDAHSTVSNTVESAKQSLSDAATKASEKASEVTETIKEKSSQMAESLKETASETTSAARNEATGETVEEAKEKTSDRVEEINETTSALTDKAKKTAAEIAETAKEKASEASENIKDKVLPDNPENRKPYTDITHSGQAADATSKKAGSFNTQSGKQEGLSNDDTRNALFYRERGAEISKKAEGVHDSAKLKGTVDPKRTPNS